MNHKLLNSYKNNVYYSTIFIFSQLKLIINSFVLYLLTNISDVLTYFHRKTYKLINYKCKNIIMILNKLYK